MAEKKDEKEEKEAVREFVEALVKNKDEIEKVIYKPYGRILLEAAIPTAIMVVGVISVAAAVILIDRRVGVDPPSLTKPQKNTE